MFVWHERLAIVVCSLHGCDPSPDFKVFHWTIFNNYLLNVPQYWRISMEALIVVLVITGASVRRHLL